jgi:hypothetical protein
MAMNNDFNNKIKNKKYTYALDDSNIFCSPILEKELNGENIFRINHSSSPIVRNNLNLIHLPPTMNNKIFNKNNKSI